jgi:hypothetical protein
MLAKAIEQKSSRRLEYRWLYPFVMSQFLDETSVGQSFLRSRAAPTRPKSEKPRKSREGKRSKRLKRQQPERKEKYRKRQCRANHEQHHELSKLSATHDVQHQRSGKKFHGGASQCPDARRRNDAIEIVVLIAGCGVSGYAGKNLFSYRSQSASASRFTAGAANRRSRLAIVSTGRNRLFQVPVPP